jgi:hypothetical protein
MRRSVGLVDERVLFQIFGNAMIEEASMVELWWVVKTRPRDDENMRTIVFALYLVRLAVKKTLGNTRRR